MNARRRTGGIFVVAAVMVRMNYRAVETESEYVARLETGAEWRAEIESLADDVDADAAWFSALGAVQDAELWFTIRKRVSTILSNSTSHSRWQAASVTSPGSTETDSRTRTRCSRIPTARRTPAT